MTESELNGQSAVWQTGNRAHHVSELNAVRITYIRYARPGSDHTTWFGRNYKSTRPLIIGPILVNRTKCFIITFFQNTLRTFVLWWRLSKRGHQTFISAVRFVIYCAFYENESSFSLFRIFRIISPKKGFYFLSPCQIEFAPKICQLKMNEFDSFKKSISMWKYIKIQVMDIR